MLCLKRWVATDRDDPRAKIYLDVGGVRVTVTVVAAEHGWARLGIEAPADVAICRADARNTEPRKRG